MGLTEERRKEIEQSLSLAETELRIVNDDPSASGIHVAMVHGRYFAAWNAAVIELLAALAEAERELSKANDLLAAADRLSGQDIVTMQKKIDYQKERVQKTESRLRELEEENARLRAVAEKGNKA